MRTVTLCLFAAATLGVCGPAAAAGYPSRTVQYIVPFGAGPTDLMARAIGACVSKKEGQPVIVVNKPGANGQLAANLVRNAAPDGYTLMVGTSATVTDMVSRRVPDVDPQRDLEPITKIAVGVQGIYVNAQLPIATVGDLIAYAKAHPGQLNYATVGIGSVHHLLTEAFSKVAGIDMVHIPYAAGTGAFITALMSDEVQVALTDVTAGQPAVDSGRVRIIGLVTTERVPFEPGVPAVVETLPDMASYMGTLWYGLFGPAHMSPDVVQSIYQDVSTCLGTPQTREAFKKMGYEESQIVPDGPAAFKTFIQTDIARLGDVVRSRKLPIR